MNQRQLIISALTKVGPETAKKMTRAFGDRVPVGGWFDCPFALGYGDPGHLVQDHGRNMDISWDDEECIVFTVTPEIVANVFGIETNEVIALTRAFDDVRDSEVSRAELFQLVKQEAMGRAVA